MMDHLTPHFQARYGEFWGKIEIETGEIIEGNLPRRALRLKQDWVELHKTELLINFEEAQKNNLSKNLLSHGQKNYIHLMHTSQE